MINKEPNTATLVKEYVLSEEPCQLHLLDWIRNIQAEHPSLDKQAIVKGLEALLVTGDLTAPKSPNILCKTAPKQVVYR